jgi:hypothetical protein
MSLLSRKGHRTEAEATISQVEMLDRLSYGEATVRVSYIVRPISEPSFEVSRVDKVRMLHLPQAGRQVQVSYDPGDHDKFEVLTPPGEELGAVATPTVEIPWSQSEKQSYIRPDGTRGYR